MPNSLSKEDFIGASPRVSSGLCLNGARIFPRVTTLPIGQLVTRNVNLDSSRTFGTSGKSRTNTGLQLEKFSLYLPRHFAPCRRCLDRHQPKPDKVCNFNCVYCEVDRRIRSRAREVRLEALEAELRAMLQIWHSSVLFDHEPFGERTASLSPSEADHVQRRWRTNRQLYFRAGGGRRSQST